MKMAVASTGKAEASEVSPVSGRAPYYLIFEDKKLVKVIPNPFKVGGGGAGFGVAKMLKGEGISLVIAGNFGEKMMDYLKEKGIDYKVAENKKVSEVVNES